jgi:hypothetical protein
MSKPSTPTPTTVPGADCVKNKTCRSPAGFNTVVRAAIAKAVSEEFGVENSPNGASQIPPVQRIARTVARVVYHTIDQNAKNNSFATPGYDCKEKKTCIIPQFALSPGNQSLYVEVGGLRLERGLNLHPAELNFKSYNIEFRNNTIL